MTDQIRTPRDVSQAIDDSVTRNLKNSWGGRFPTWEEYKVANKGGRVRANKNIGMKAIHLRGVPRGFWFLFGMVTPWGMFAAPVVCISSVLPAD